MMQTSWSKVSNLTECVISSVTAISKELWCVFIANTCTRLINATVVGEIVHAYIKVGAVSVAVIIQNHNNDLTDDNFESTKF